MGCSLIFDGDQFEDPPGDEAPRPDSGGAATGADAAPEATADAAPEPDAAPPVDASGAYTVALTNRENECGFPNWVEGTQTSGVPLTVAQTGSAATAEVGGPAGTFLVLILGSSAFEGTVEGADLDLTLFGTSPFMAGSCTYTINAVVDAALDGDVLEGRIEYRASTNGSPDCGALEDCSSVQEFNGTRPPS